MATLTIVGKTEQDTGFKFDFDDDSLYEDEAVWNLIGSKYTTTLFQIGSKTYKDRMPRIKPKNIQELANCLALLRGPCISAKTDVAYMEIIEGKREVELIHPFYDEATKDTNGILIYQEDLMQIAVNFGFSLEDGFKLMKAVAKKKFDKIAEFEVEYRRLAEEQNVPLDAQDRIWQIIMEAGLYLFNRGHAVAYALLCYQSAYLKIYFPMQYMCNSLTNAYIRKEEIEETIAECRRLGIKFSGVDMNQSQWEFTIDEETGSIRVGLCAIKAFGDKAAAAMIAYRPFTDIQDFIERVPKSVCSKRAIVPGIFAGLFDSYNPDRLAVYKEFCEIRDEEPLETIKLAKESFDVADIYQNIESVVLGCPITSSPVNSFEAIGFNSLRRNERFVMDAVILRVKKLKDRNQNQMAFLTLETADGLIDATIFAAQYKEYRKFYKKNLIIKLTGKKDKDNSCIVLEIA